MPPTMVTAEPGPSDVIIDHRPSEIPTSDFTLSPDAEDVTPGSAETETIPAQRQSAPEAQAADNRVRFLELVVAACAQVPADVAGDPGDVCATGTLGAEPEPLSVEEAPEFYSGIITGPDFCTDLSLGGPRTYAFDSDGDGVADICSLPWSEREEAARQIALNA